MKIKLFIIIFPFILLISACSSANKSSPVQVPTSTPPAVIATATATPMPTLPPLPTATSSPQTVEATASPSPTPTLSPSPIASPTTTPSPVPESSPTASPSTTQAAQAAVTSSGCTDIANFVDDETIPDGTSFRMGDTFTKTWKVRNDGTCTWDSTYALVSAGGVVMNAPLTNPLPEVSPGTTANISINMTAPARGGVYQSNWEFQDPSGARFGVGPGVDGLLWAQIAVSFVDPTATQAVAAASTPTAPGTPTPASQGACAATRDTSVEAQVLALINQARTSQGLNALQSQDQLTAAALAHSMDMACNNFVDHIGSDGSLWYDRVKAQGYANYNSSRENIYVGHPEFGGNAQGAFTWWWNSKIHHDNMLNPDVTQIGIAYVFDPNSQYGGYYTTVFARP